MWKAAASELLFGADAGSPRRAGANLQATAALGVFDAHVSRFNARRSRSASRCFAAAMLVLLVANISLPSLRLWQHAGSQVIGILYFVARIMDWGNIMAANAAADYGKTFLIAAGLLNFIAAADAHHIALGKKP